MQLLPSVQLALTFVLLHVPFEHTSVVQVLPSVHALALLAVKTQPLVAFALPLAGLHVSSVHAWPSSQALVAMARNTQP